MNSFLLLCEVFSFVFWKKLKTPNKLFEINFEKTHPNENSTAIGTTSIQFQNSGHKFMFINIYLEHPTTSKNVKIVIGAEEQGTFTVSIRAGNDSHKRKQAAQ